jgi:hypothetical protein
MSLAQKTLSLLTVLLTLALGGSSWAQEVEGSFDDEIADLGSGAAPDLEAPEAPEGLSAERLALWRDLRRAYVDEAWSAVEDLRDQRLVYRALSGSSAVKADEVWKLVTGMRSSRERLRAAQKAFSAKLADNGFQSFEFGLAGGARFAPCRSDDGFYDDRFDRSSMDHGAAYYDDDRPRYRHRGFRNRRRGGW